ncbi:MAG: hypothetical protein ACOH2N_10000 [Devosia sp.]
MGFNLNDHWVWDFWLADDGTQYHLYYLHAPKSLGNPDLRHRHARIGHATSPDLRNWSDHGRVFDAGVTGSFDGSATWTGSIVRAPDGQWKMFYTGSRFLSPEATANIETIGLATSSDLFAWTKQPGPISVADPALYETLGTSTWPEEAWRDPWVFWRADDQLWHMLITARGKTGTEPDRGVVGHAVSSNLVDWSVRAPLSQGDSGFAHLEVFQMITIAGQQHLIFCCDSAKMAGARAGSQGGIWTMPVDNMPAQIDPSVARLLVDDRLYAGRIATDREGSPWLLAFNNTTVDGQFTGGISDPMRVSVGHDGYLTLEARS